MIDDKIREKRMQDAIRIKKVLGNPDISVNFLCELMKSDKERAQEEEERRRIKKKEQKEERRIRKVTVIKKVSKKIAAVALAAVLLTGGCIAKELPSYFDGKNQIIDRFAEVTNGYGVTDTSMGFVIYHNGETSLTREDFDRMTHEMVSLGKDAGMTDDEIYIGLESKISAGAAAQTMGYNMNLSSEWDTCIQNAHEKTI